jgi:CobQ-like glutamine amidotransferase family enzyme
VNLSNATLLKESGLDEKTASGNDGFTCCACYEIVGKCVYDIEKEKMKILSMIAFSGDNKNAKIQSLIQEKMHDGIAIFSERETHEFLEKLRKMYETKSSAR